MKFCLLLIKSDLRTDAQIWTMPETVKDDPAEKVNELSDEEVKEKADEALERFKDKLRKYSSE